MGIFFQLPTFLYRTCFTIILHKLTIISFVPVTVLKLIEGNVLVIITSRGALVLSGITHPHDRARIMINSNSDSLFFIRGSRSTEPCF